MSNNKKTGLESILENLLGEETVAEIKRELKAERAKASGVPPSAGPAGPAGPRSAGGPAGPQQRISGREAPTASPRRTTASPPRSTASPQRNTASPQRSTVSPQRGAASPSRNARSRQGDDTTFEERQAMRQKRDAARPGETLAQRSRRVRAEAQAQLRRSQERREVSDYEKRDRSELFRGPEDGIFEPDRPAESGEVFEYDDRAGRQGLFDSDESTALERHYEETTRKNVGRGLTDNENLPLDDQAAFDREAYAADPDYAEDLGIKHVDLLPKEHGPERTRELRKAFIWSEVFKKHPDAF